MRRIECVLAHKAHVSRELFTDAYERFAYLFFLLQHSAHRTGNANRGDRGARPVKDGSPNARNSRFIFLAVQRISAKAHGRELFFQLAHIARRNPRQQSRAFLFICVGDHGFPQ